MLLNGLQVTDDDPYTYALKNADVQLGPEPTNLQLPAGTDATVAGKPAKGTQASYAPMFVPFPQ